MRALVCLSLFATGCFFTNFHSPRALKSGEITGGAHAAGVLVEDADGVVTVAGTVRVGTDIGELGAAYSGFGAEASFKVPLTPRDGTTHVSALGTVGTYLFVFPEATVGLLAGQDFGPFTAYGGYRQHLFSVGLNMGHFIGGFELRVSEYVSIMGEANYTTLYTGDADDDSLLSAFEVPVLSIGLNFGRTRSRPAAEPPPIQTGPPGAI